MKFSNKSKILVLGSTGMLGYAVTKYYQTKGYSITALTSSDYNILQDPLSKLNKYTKEHQLVINCAGLIKPRIAKMSPEEALQINGIFPKNLAKLCRNNGIPCIHITTDCVYSGKKGNYTENDYYDIDDLYGLSKNAGENSECMTIRTSIIGEEVNNKYSLLEWAISQKGKQVTGYSNHLWNGVTTVYLAELIERIMIEDRYLSDIVHLHSPGVVTKYELLCQIDKVYKLGLSIEEGVATQRIDRTLKSINSLSSDIANVSLDQQIVDMYRFFKKP